MLSLLINPVTTGCMGIAMGIASKWMDINTSFLGTLFSQLSIWVLFCTTIAAFSKGPVKAGINVLTFCLGMLTSYYIMAELTNSIWGMNFAAGWTKFALLTPILAAVVWFAANPYAISKLIRLAIIGVMITAQILMYGIGVHDFIIAAVILLIFKAAERRKKGEYKYDEYSYDDNFNDGSDCSYGSTHRRSRVKGVVGRIMAILLLITVVSGSIAVVTSMGKGTTASASLDNGWNLVLVNSEYSIPDDYTFELVTLANGEQIDSRVYPHLQQMFDDMRNENIWPIAAHGYRSRTKQNAMMTDKVHEFLEKGYSTVKAKAEARKWVAEPGTSEHEIGISVDINHDPDKSTAEDVYNWLADNAHKYGFIYRYPVNKSEITGISNEPWHYRYVGTEAATYIYENGLCLEEYIEQLV